MNDFMDQLAEDAADLTAAPSDNQMALLREKGIELVDVTAEIYALEIQLSGAKKLKTELAHKTLPDIMLDMGSDSLGLLDAGVDIVLADYAHANIPKDWEEERRDAAFEHLEYLGAGDLVKSIMTIPAGKGDMEAMRALVSLIKVAMENDADSLLDSVTDWVENDELAEHLQPVSASVSLELAVPWNSLTAFVKEHSAKKLGPDDPVLNVDAIGATIGKVVKIKKRKE